MMDDDFQFALGPPDSGFSIFLADRTKKIHFIRHAEGTHNAAVKKFGSNACLLRGNYKKAWDHPHYDARLTSKGIKQAHALRNYLARRPSEGRSFTTFDLVVVSPLTRACETALHIFGRPRPPGVPAFLAAGEAPPGTPEHRVGLPVPPPRFLVREECRERWGKFACDGRRTIREVSREFPGFDWSELVHDEEVFHTDERESAEHCSERAVRFLGKPNSQSNSSFTEWLNSRPEPAIAVVTHSNFLRALFHQFGQAVTFDDREELQRKAGNCELRSVVLCSHGNKDGREVVPLMPPMVDPSTLCVEEEDCSDEESASQAGGGGGGGGTAKATAAATGAAAGVRPPLLFAAAAAVGPGPVLGAAAAAANAPPRRQRGADGTDKGGGPFEDDAAFNDVVVSGGTPTY